MPGPRRRHKNPRAQTSCAICHRRKVKCDGKAPCGQCSRRRQAAACVYQQQAAPNPAPRTSPGAPRRRQGEPGASSSSEAGEPEIERAVGVDVNATQPPGDDALVPPPRPRLRTEPVQEVPGGAGFPSEPASCAPAGASRPESKLPTHDWGHNDDHIRGRSHLAWAVHLFEPLLVYLGEPTASEGQRKDRIPLLQTTYDQWRRDGIQTRNAAAAPPGSLADELPSAVVVRALVGRYLETFHAVLPVLRDEAGFADDLDALLADPAAAPLHLLVQVLLMMALASGTYHRRREEAEASSGSATAAGVIPPEQAAAWCDLGSSVPTTTLELGEGGLDVLRCAALLNLAKQTLKFNDTADYVYSGAGLRLAVMLGLNRRGGGGGGTDPLWDTVRELDLHACLACGAAPTVPPGTDLSVGPAASGGKQQPGSHDEDDSSPLAILRRSLDTRVKIAVLVNNEERLRFEDAVQLSRDLARDMSPVSTSPLSADGGEAHRENDGGSTGSGSFAYRYAAFVYAKNLAALHRPFAALRHPALHLSRDLSRGLAAQHLRTVCGGSWQRRRRRWWDGGDGDGDGDGEGGDEPEDEEGFSSRDPFGALLAGNGTMFRVELLQSALWLAAELYRATSSSRSSEGRDDEDDNDDLYMYSTGGGSATRDEQAEELLDGAVAFAGAALRRREPAGLAFLLPGLVLRHARARREAGAGPGSAGAYKEAMTIAGRDLRDLFVSGFG